MKKQLVYRCWSHLIQYQLYFSHYDDDFMLIFIELQMRKLLNVASVMGAAGAVFYTYISYQAKHNLSQYVKQERNLGVLTGKPSLRATSQQIEEINKNLKSGDNFFMKYDHTQALSVDQYLRGLFDSWTKLPEELGSLGYVYKNNEGTYVLYNEFGETKVKKLQEFINLPFITVLFYQKNKDNIDFQTRLSNLLEKNGKVDTSETKKQPILDMLNRVNKQLYQDKHQFILDVRQMSKKDQMVAVKTRIERIIDIINSS